MSEFNEVLLLLQQMCVYLVIAYLLSKTRLFTPLMQVTIRLPHKVLCYVIFSMFCVMGTYLGLHVEDSIANTRGIGAVLGGILGGPSVGFLVGLTGGLHRYSMGGITAFPCALSTIIAGVLGGITHRIAFKKGRIGMLFNPFVVAGVTAIAEAIEMMNLVLFMPSNQEAKELIGHIIFPMVICNTVGAGMFMQILLDRRAMFEKYSSAFSSTALKIAARTEGILRHGFDQENSMKVARILYQELGIGAVAITDREKLLAFIGIGDDHHLPGTPIASIHTYNAIDHNEVVYADGNAVPYACSLSLNCKLGATLVIPLRGENDSVIGTIKLYEPKSQLFSTINRTLGEGIASLLSAQILAGQYEHHKEMLAQSEIKLLQAQVNPHFLFNALNTLVAVIRQDKNRASELVQYLSTFFRKNLKRADNDVTLKDELEHVHAYLQIEKARFADRLEINVDIPESLLSVHLPMFSLQPLVENAIKHGTSQLLDIGRIDIKAYQEQQSLKLLVIDNAGLFIDKPSSDGLGMNIVDKRIKQQFGEQYGMDILCQPEQFTQITLTLPMKGEPLC